MKRLAFALVLLAVVAAVGYRVADISRASAGSGYEVGLVYDPVSLARAPEVRAAYNSVLQEEGVDHRWISADDLSLVDGADLAARFPALIFPDGVAQRLPDVTADRVGEYMAAGGRVLVVFDAGTRTPAGPFRSGGVLASAVGVQYLRYQSLGTRSYLHGGIHFESAARAGYWDVPPGKLFRGQVVGGYAYGGLTYPVASAARIDPSVRVDARVGSVPAVSVRRSGRGTAVWVDLPLGYLKGQSDDLPLRAVLRTFLFRIAGLPHLVATPDGVPGLVVSWHIDSAVEWRGIPSLLRSGLARPGLREEFDITAGPDRDRPGDGLGFDACGRGAPLVRALARLGDIGSHGGWAHNWFAVGLETHRFGVAQITDLIRRNDTCLERITGRPVRSYAAPEGVHPQPTVTRILQRLGIDSYYYTGDTGAPPNRTFFRGRMVSPSVWAFPVMPDGRYASIGEMLRAGLSAAQVRAWLDATLRYTIAQRSVRLLYSHPYDLLHPAVRRQYAGFIDTVARLQREGRIRTLTMTGYAQFMSRFVRTTVAYRRQGSWLLVSLDNPQGLRGITVTIPAGPLAPVARSITVRTDATHAAVRLEL